VAQRVKYTRTFRPRRSSSAGLTDKSTGEKLLFIYRWDDVWWWWVKMTSSRLKMDKSGWVRKIRLGQFRSHPEVDSRPGRCEGHSWGSLSGVPFGSGWLPEFSCSSIHELTSAPWLIPSQFGVEAGAHVLQCHSVRHLCEQHPCALSFWSSSYF